MRVVVTGREGQLARALVERADAHGVELLALGRPALDLTRPETLRALEGARPDVIVNAAAHTRVDAAESEPALAHAINGSGAGAVAEAAAALGVPLIQISTDYVFDGTAPRPYREDDATGPVSAYGASKLAGERAVAAAQPDHAILRTAWVHSPFGRNFVKTMLALAETRDEIAVVSDQHGCPTFAPDLADAVLVVARHLVAEPALTELRGVFHVAGGGETDWASFAEAILAGLSARGGPSARIRRISSAEYPTPARRPANSRLDTGKLAALHGHALPHWADGLERALDRLIIDGKVAAP